MMNDTAQIILFLMLGLGVGLVLAAVLVVSLALWLLIFGAGDFAGEAAEEEHCRDSRESESDGTGSTRESQR